MAASPQRRMMIRFFFGKRNALARRAGSRRVLLAPVIKPRQGLPCYLICSGVVLPGPSMLSLTAITARQGRGQHPKEGRELSHLLGCQRHRGNVVGQGSRVPAHAHWLHRVHCDVKRLAEAKSINAPWHVMHAVCCAVSVLSAAWLASRRRQSRAPRAPLPHAGGGEVTGVGLRRQDRNATGNCRVVSANPLVCVQASVVSSLGFAGHRNIVAVAASAVPS